MAPLDLPATGRSIVANRPEQGGEAMAEPLTIGKFAQATGVPAKTIRYYEQVGVLPAPTRTAAGYRQYTPQAAHRLLFIRRARDLQRYRYTFLLLGLMLLVVPLAPVFGREINGARIWAKIGPLSFQPGEFAKVALVIFFAAYLVEKRELLGMATFPRFRPMLPPE